ncbi:ABC transporter related protein [Thermogladius calderae 1633]|uniref:ABC transporter related protein n=2 Tax=Thermogladius TaxID=477695 RepID=I3TFG6_THEC1|nr:ABC transporter ATP-binding protein [Thermogladius calderae]AFK51504.1 ABC transporter related protein [Thermogladius calderae 1633]
MTRLLELRRVNAGYGEFKVLHDVSLYVDKGEIVAVVGPNGAGKTTLLRTIMGYTTLYSGSVVFKSVDISGKRVHERVALGLTMVPEGRGIFPNLTVEENLLAGAYLERDKSKVRERLELVYSIFPRLKERRGQLAGSLSGGEAQMLALGRGLMTSPMLLLVDEMSLGLAPKVVLALFDLVVKLNKEYGLTMLVVEQHVKNALEISSRGYVLENGRVVLEGDGRSLLSNEMLKKAYLIY